MDFGGIGTYSAFERCCDRVVVPYLSCVKLAAILKLPSNVSHSCAF